MTERLETAGTTPRKGLSRRTVAQGLAWTAPVVAVASGAPAFASTGAAPIYFTGGECKLPGSSCSPFDKGYLFGVSVTNTSAVPVYLYVSTDFPAGVTPNPSPGLTFTGTVPSGFVPTYGGAQVGSTLYTASQTVILPPGTAALTVNAYSAGSSQDLSNVTFNLIFQWGHTPAPANDRDHLTNPVTITWTVHGTNPCKSCQAAPVITTTATNPASGTTVVVGSTLSASVVAQRLNADKDYVVTTRLYGPYATAPATGSAPSGPYQEILTNKHTTAAVSGSGGGDIAAFDVTSAAINTPGYYVWWSSVPSNGPIAGTTDQFARSGTVVQVTAAPAPAPAAKEGAPAPAESSATSNSAPADAGSSAPAETAETQDTAPTQ